MTKSELRIKAQDIVIKRLEKEFLLQSKIITSLVKQVEELKVDPRIRKYKAIRSL